MLRVQFILFLVEHYGMLTCIGFETITVNYGTDIPNLNGRHRKYLYGPGSYVTPILCFDIFFQDLDILFSSYCPDAFHFIGSKTDVRIAS